MEACQFVKSCTIMSRLDYFFLQRYSLHVNLMDYSIELLPFWCTFTQNVLMSLSRVHNFLVKHGNKNFNAHT